MGISEAEPSERRWETQIGDRVRFSLVDVFLPDPQEALASLSLDSEVEGIVSSFSESGQAPRAYALVDVILRRIVVVPVDRLRLEPDADQSGKEIA